MSETLSVDGTPITLRRSARARRMTLRVSRRDGAVVLTVPPGLPIAEAIAFVDSRRQWLARVRAELPAPQRAVFGAVLPVEGTGLVLTPAAVRRAARKAAVASLLRAESPQGRLFTLGLEYLATGSLLSAQAQAERWLALQPADLAEVLRLRPLTGATCQVLGPETTALLPGDTADC